MEFLRVSLIEEILFNRRLHGLAQMIVNILCCWWLYV